MALCWSNRRAGRPEEEGERGMVPSRLSKGDSNPDDTRQAKGRGHEALGMCNYGGKNVSVCFSRIFPFESSAREISTLPPWQPSTGSSTRAEAEFLKNLHLFSGLVGGHLLIDSGTWEGSATLLSPPIPLGEGKGFVTFWATAGHNVLSDNGQLLKVDINPQVYQLPQGDWFTRAYARNSSFTHRLEVVSYGSRDYQQFFSQVDLSPTKYGKAESLGPSPDLAFCRVICSDPSWPFVEPHAEPKWHVPNPRIPKSGDLMLKIGYPGVVSKSDFYEQYKSVLSASQLNTEWPKVDGSVLQRQTFSASPCEVYLVGDDLRVVKDKGSTWSGMSGGATLDMADPRLLNGVHHAQSKKFNHFLSVHHPFFACGYADMMGAYLGAMDTELRPLAAEYLNFHKPLLKTASLWKKVKGFVDGWLNLPGLSSTRGKRKRNE